MLNKVMLIGHVGQEPGVRDLPNGGQVATLRLATSERWKDKQGNKQEKTEWHTLVFWREGLINVVANYVSKGSLIWVEGRLETREYEKDGVKHKSTEIKVDNLQLLDKREKQASGYDTDDEIEF